jgi:hypothetical protein
MMKAECLRGCLDWEGVTTQPLRRVSGGSNLAVGFNSRLVREQTSVASATPEFNRRGRDVGTRSACPVG